MLRAYKYRLNPTIEQKILFEKHIGSCRFVYNWALNMKITTYKETGKSISKFNLNNLLPELKNEYEWLKEVNSQSLQGMTDRVERAYKKFFRDKIGYPKFKSKKNPIQSFPIPQRYKVDFEKGIVKLPNIGEMKAVLHRRFEGKLKTATVSKTRTGKYYVSVIVDDGKDLPEKQYYDNSSTISVDVGIKDFAVLSTGEKIENPKFLKNSITRIKVLQRKLSRKVKGSNNRKKDALKIAKIHEKIHNQRNDFQGKLSFKLISENQAIALENLNVKGMIRNHHLAQAISDASWSSFVGMLMYKAEQYGKTILKIGRFEPSSKTCSVCGYHKSDLTLKDREWTCPNCNTLHDRDINAAINIKNFALTNISPMEHRVELEDSLTQVKGMNQETLRLKIVR